ncbi:MAG: hypothetical protein QMC37_04905 [Flavobacteriales bacterium]
MVGIIETDNTAAKHYALKALGVLGQHATDKDVERLVALLDPHRRKFMLLRDTDDKVWELRALGVLGQRVVKDEHVKRVVDVLHDTNQQNRDTAAETLGFFGKRAEKYGATIVAMLDGENRVQIAETLLDALKSIYMN